MPSGTLYTNNDNNYSFKVLVAALYGGSEVTVAPDFTFGVTNKSDSFLKKFPLGKVPAFETSDNQPLFESDAIAFYVADDALRGNSRLDQALIKQWTNFANLELYPSVCTWVFPILEIIKNSNKNEIDRAKELLKKKLMLLNQHLNTRTFLVGERVTLADIAIACTLLPAYQHAMDPSYRESFVNLNRWFLTCLNQPHFKSVVGEVTLCEKEPQIQRAAPTKAPKAEKPKAKKPEVVKPKEVKEELDEADKILAQENSAKDPFEAFPKGTFVMDSFKKCYSNEDESTSIAYFWKNFDKENYSIWYSEYKYPEDLALTYMSCNLIGGMFQRLDKMRKHAFGSVCLFGEDNNSTISGIWVWRGHELAFKLSDNLQTDYESYDWKKLDPDTDETKKLVNEYFSWAGDFDGKKFNQGKIYK